MRLLRIWEIPVCVRPLLVHVVRGWADVSVDAMNEAAWCYVEGFGCKKDKVRFSRFSRGRCVRRADSSD